jgi:hypothetical protein
LKQGRAFRIDQQPDAVLFNDRIPSCRDIDFHDVLPAGATAFFHAQSQAPRFRCRLLRKQGTKVMDGCRGCGDHGVLLSKLQMAETFGFAKKIPKKIHFSIIMFIH